MASWVPRTKSQVGSGGASTRVCHQRGVHGHQESSWDRGEYLAGGESKTPWGIRRGAEADAPGGRPGSAPGQPRSHRSILVQELQARLAERIHLEAEPRTAVRIGEV